MNGAKRNVCPGSCVSTGAKFPVAPVESAPMVGGVATYAKCGGIFSIHLSANLLRNISVKNVFKSVKICQNYGHESVAPLFWPTLYI